MSNNPSYKSTVYACYIGHFVLASVINTTPILFLTLMNRYGLSFEQMGRLVLINFVTQVTVDLAASRFVDKHGLRSFIVGAQLLAFAGFVLFAGAPFLFGNVYAGFVLATVVFSAGGGLLELLLSPIVNAIPTQEKARAMSLLHAFYAWGQVTVVLLTSALLTVLGPARWVLIPLFWSLLPLANTVLFAKVPLAPVVEEARRTKLKDLLRQKVFLVCLAGILVSGAAEITMAQWASGFLEEAMRIPKIIGDSAGVGVFALAIGIGRTVYGKMGARMNIQKAMTAGAGLTLACYVVVVFSNVPALSLAACALSGFGVSLLWPGSLVLAAERFPLAGTSMFAVLAASGDFGAATGPWMVGLVADNAVKLPAVLRFGSSGLRSGFLFAAVFPAAMLICMRYIRKHKSGTLTPTVPKG